MNEGVNINIKHSDTKLQTVYSQIRKIELDLQKFATYNFVIYSICLIIVWVG